jgi:predicted DNA-binding ribbon-helix-helix protein
MTDHLQKRSLLLAGHKTSLALELPFWDVLQACAQAKGVSLAGLICAIDAEKPLDQPLASAARLAALHYALGVSPGGRDG